MQLSLCLVPALPEELREATSTPRRIGWASLLARVFAVDVTVCSKCGGRMKIVEVVTDPAAIAKLQVPVEPEQLSVFSTKLDELCERVGLNWVGVKHLWSLDLLSFNPEQVADLNACQEQEIIFLGTLVAAGCDDRMLRALVRGLEPPYSYNIDRILYDWTRRQWVARTTQDDLDEAVQEAIENYSADHEETKEADADTTGVSLSEAALKRLANIIENAGGDLSIRMLRWINEIGWDQAPEVTCGFVENLERRNLPPYHALCELHEFLEYHLKDREAGEILTPYIVEAAIDADAYDLSGFEGEQYVCWGSLGGSLCQRFAGRAIDFALMKISECCGCPPPWEAVGLLFIANVLRDVAPAGYPDLYERHMWFIGSWLSSSLDISNEDILEAATEAFLSWGWPTRRDQRLDVYNRLVASSWRGMLDADYVEPALADLRHDLGLPHPDDIEDDD